MGDGGWLVCSACGLRHTPRPDGRCPRCKAPSAPPDFDAAGAWRPPPPPAWVVSARDATSRGARIAGVFLLLNGVLGVAGALRVGSVAGVRDTVTAAGALAGAGLGAAILGGSSFARKTVILLTALAVPALLVLGAATRAWALAGAVLLVCLAYLALLVGDPGPFRVAPAAAIVAASCAAGLVAAAAPGPFAERLLALSGAVESAPVTVASGDAWRLTLPPGRWFRARRAVGGALPDATFVRPDGPAWLAVFPVETRGASTLDPDVAARVGSESVARQFDRWTLVDVSPLPGRGATRVLHGVAVKDGTEIEVLCGLFPNGPLFHVAVAGAAPRVFARLHGELTDALASFSSDSLPMPPAPLPAAPAVPAR
ncbi:MAG TPA: hypothetical protein VMN04_06425 [Thermoanaerobaculia bacterium]|nr:hypothetical protein [Thermoanaerobaculia bacterium]